MKKKAITALAAALFVALLCSMASAGVSSISVADVNVGRNDDGSGFITGDTNIEYTLTDTNTHPMSEVYYLVNIYYGATAGAKTTAIVTDLNLGDINAGTGYCLTGPPHSGFGSAGNQYCYYKWPSATIGAIADGNYFIDVNVWQATKTGGIIPDTDANYDSNSFYIDNTNPPPCEIQQKQGNQMNWYVGSEATPEALGSRTTLYYSVDSSTVFSSLQAQELAGNLTDGSHTYRCYSMDSAGNTTATTEETIQYPSQDVATILGGGAQAIVGGEAVGDAIEFAKANPIVIGIVLVAGYLVLGGGKKRKKRRR